jgi:hypothetical protein
MPYLLYIKYGGRALSFGLCVQTLEPDTIVRFKKGEKMNLKRGIVVSHMSMSEWGAGMVVAVGDGRATIQFSDGIIRKIAASHYSTLQPADATSYLAPPDNVPEVKKVRAVRKSVKKTKEPAV